MMQKIMSQLDAYQYTNRLLLNQALLNESISSNKKVEQLEKYAEVFSFSFFNPLFRTLKLQKSLIFSVENTRNVIRYRKLPFPQLFINNYFEIKDMIISGIFLQDNSYGALIKETGEVEYENMIDIYFININGDGMQSYYYKYGEEFDYLSRKISNIVSNIIDLLNSKDEVEIGEILIPKERNEKRAKKNKNPLPNKIIIKPKKDFQKYLDNLENDRRKISHKFLVRGHWRHLKSDKFHKKGTSVWIKPYFKGQGIYIPKKYELKNNEV